MNLVRKNLWFCFLFTLLLTLYGSVIAPKIHLLYFAPFLVILLYQKSRIASIYIGMACGVITDLFTSGTRLGIYACVYAMTVSILYGRKRYFFGDSLTTLPIMTFFFSCISTFLLAAFLYIFEHRNIVSWAWTISDLFIMSLEDALYAFSIFILPFWLIGKRPRRGQDYFKNEV